MPRRLLALWLILFVANVSAQERRIPLAELRSGLSFASPEIRATQADDFGNPAMLWVERGVKLWSEPAGVGGRSCASCHHEAPASMKGVAAAYPRIDAKSGRLLDLEGRINQCRVERQQSVAFRPESDELLGITAYVAMQSRGVPVRVSIEGPARAHFEAGRTLYYRRMGQMNLACAHCHEANWGRKLLAETISQGHGNPYPIYRLEWQKMGSLQRRLRSCLIGIRGEPWSYGSMEHLDLALYLAWRAEGLPIESPGVRR